MKTRDQIMQELEGLTESLDSKLHQMVYQEALEDAIQRGNLKPVTIRLENGMEIKLK